MNSFIQKIIIALGLTATIMLVSCQGKSTILPATPVKNLNPVANSSGGGSGFVERYLLVKHGKAALSYDADGLLKRVMTDPDVSSSYTTYSFGNAISNSIEKVASATAYESISGYEKLVEHDTYFLDPVTGYCTKTWEERYAYYPSDPNLKPSTSRDTWVHEYDAQGHIKKSYDKYGYAAFTYTFDAAGDMTTVKQFYDGKLIATVFLEYNQNWVDKNPINRDWTGPLNRYLKIFGKPVKHLLKRVVKKSFFDNQTLFDHTYYYTLNSNGYVMEEKVYNTATGAVVSLKPHSYQTTFLDIRLIP